MNKIKQLYYQLPRWLRWLTGASIIGLAVASGLQKITPPLTPTPNSPLVETSYLGDKTSFSQVRYTGTPITLANELSVYRAQTLSVSTVLNKLITEFQLEKKAENYWQSTSHSLIYDQELHLFRLTRRQLDDTRELKTTNEMRAVNSAQNLIERLFDSNLEPLVDKLVYLKGGDELQLTHSASKANYISVPFSYKLSGFPVFFYHDSYPPVSVLIKSDGQVQKLEFKDKLLTFQITAQLESLTVEQAVNNINHGVASIVEANPEKLEPISLNQIVGANLNKVSLEYRLDSTNQVLPYYHFVGKAKNSQGQTLDIEVITPAVKSRPQKNK